MSRGGCINTNRLNPLPFNLTGLARLRRPDAGLRDRVTAIPWKGFQFTQIYQPASRYWPLQWIEFTMYAAAAVLLLALAIRWTTRRIS